VKTWIKDPDEVLQYIFDWAALENSRGDSNWLDRTSSPVETISSITIATDSPGLTVDSSSITDTNTSVTVQLSGGSAGNRYKVVCQIVTSAGQTAERTALINVVER